MKRVLLCDFDGTIVMVDTCEYLLDTFVTDDWRAFNTLLERGAITLEECTQQQLALLSLTEDEALTALGPITSFRPHFRELVDYCATHSIRFIVVSGGLDFVINHFLQAAGVEQRVRVYAATSRITSTGIDLTFPDRVDDTALDFKEDVVKQHLRQGFHTFYVGDGLSDLNAARRAPRFLRDQGIQASGTLPTRATTPPGNNRLPRSHYDPRRSHVPPTVTQQTLASPVNSMTTSNSFIIKKQERLPHQVNPWRLLVERDNPLLRGTQA